MIGKTIGHYRVGEQLGRGGMGEVYLADDLNLTRKVSNEQENALWIQTKPI